jgi:hypothetical protein
MGSHLSIQVPVLVMAHRTLGEPVIEKAALGRIVHCNKTRAHGVSSRHRLQRNNPHHGWLLASRGKMQALEC